MKGIGLLDNASNVRGSDIELTAELASAKSLPLYTRFSSNGRLAESRLNAFVISESRRTLWSKPLFIFSCVGMR
jgi:hypothetical protein